MHAYFGFVLLYVVLLQAPIDVFFHRSCTVLRFPVVSLTAPAVSFLNVFLVQHACRVQLLAVLAIYGSLLRVASFAVKANEKVLICSVAENTSGDGYRSGSRTRQPDKACLLYTSDAADE